MMSTIRNDDSEDEYSVIGDKGEIGFIDFEDNKSVSNYDPMTEGPVYISVPFPFVRGKPQSVIVGETSKCAITIENTTNDPVELWAVKIFCSNPTDSFTLSLMEPPSMNSRGGNVRGFFEAYFLEDRVLQPYETLNIWLFCKPKEMGLHTTVVHFDAGDDRIERVVFLLAEDSVSQSLAPNRQYSRAPMRKGFSGDLVPNRPNSRFPTRKQFSGGDSAVSSRTEGATTHYFKYKLRKFPIPTNVRESLQDNQIPEVVMEGLCGKNYASFFKTLLIMEELRLEEDMRCHNMEWVSLRKKGAHLLALEVPGLAERRPSLVNGDHVFVKLASDYASDNTVYKGYIYRVEADEVLLQFPKALHDRHRNGSLFSVQFSYNRVNMRRLYQAVEAAESLDPHLLFPSLSTKRRLVKATEFVPFTRNVNEEQMRAVKMILGCKGAPPYVIYGPPGTGKTMTLVEAMLQVHATRKSGRILVCAASNSAADHILEKMVCNELAEVKEREIFRLNATSRPYEDVRPDHIRFCYFEDSIFRCPPLMALQKYSIIICTYMSSSLLYAEGVSRGHFSHIFLDESGQASEPECMVPISSLCTRETVIVLAGDPKQLGPVVHSKDAERFGLGKSYLERLFECEFYKNEEEEFVTKLVKNYRCHRAILDLPSKLFYKGELIAAKECTSPSIISDVNFLPNKEFPVLFIGIQGCDEREGNNPSWFNRIEASKVVEIINKLRTSTDIAEADIGVITPYRQQVLKIKTVLESKEMSDVKVGSVEQFQGQEREVIIVSTVRSTVKHNDFDRTYCLGFLSNPKRFNVAITRAKALLVIIGNPHIITKDPYWEKLLWLCADNNSYQGCPLPERRYIPEKNLSSEVDDSCHSKVESWVQSVQQDIPEIPKLIISDGAGQY